MPAYTTPYEFEMMDEWDKAQKAKKKAVQDALNLPDSRPGADEAGGAGGDVIAEEWASGAGQIVVAIVPTAPSPSKPRRRYRIYPKQGY